MNKIFISMLAMSLLLVGCVSGLLVAGEEKSYSFDNSNETHIWRDAQTPPVKTLITKNEYNKIFEDYKAGILTQEQSSKKLRSSKW